MSPAAKLEPDEPDGETDADQRKLLDEVLADIRAFKPEKDVAPKTLELKAETVDRRMANAKAKAAAISAHGKSLDRVLEKIDALVDRQASLSRVQSVQPVKS